MRLKRFFSLLLSLTIISGTISLSGITAAAKTSKEPWNTDRYFYFTMEYPDLNKDIDSPYRIVNPVKVYENGFYDCNGEFVSFTKVCEEYQYYDATLESYYNNCETNEVLADSVADAVYIMLYYYCLGVPTTDVQEVFEMENYISYFDMQAGFLNSITDEIAGKFEENYGGYLCFRENSASTNNGMGSYKWIDGTLTAGNVYRFLCDYEDASEYTSPASDELVSAIADYYEACARANDDDATEDYKSAVENAQKHYESAIAGYFSENASDLAEDLQSAVPSLPVKQASIGNVTINNYPNKTVYVKGNGQARLTGNVSTYAGTTLSYQWYRDDVAISSATENYYMLQNEPAGKHKYKLVATASYSSTNTAVASAEKEIVIYNPPIASACSSNNKTKIYAAKDKPFTLVGTGMCDTENYPENTLSYQWCESNYDNASYPTEIKGEISNNLTLTPSEYGTKYYYLKVWDKDGNTALSKSVKVTVIPPFDEKGWDGTFDKDEDEPTPNYDTMTYSIGTPEQLAWYADYVNSTVKASNYGFADVYNAILTDDIDLNNIPWTPIGTNTGKVAINFTFDGNGHTVKNLYCTDSVSGLFGTIGYVITDYIQVQGKYCYIKNLTVEGYPHGSSYAGLVAGQATCTYFENVTVKGNSGDENTGYAGGIVGRENGCKFTNCINYADICANSGNGCSGGIAGYQIGTWACTGGYILEDNTQYLKTVIKNCINLGKVTGSKNSGAMLGYITHYDNDLIEYDSYKYTGKDPTEYVKNICIAVEFENNLTLNTASAKTLSAKKTMTEVNTAKTVDTAECADGKCSIDIFKNGLTALNSDLSGDVTAYINNKNENVKNGTVILALYDADGRMIEIKTLPKELNVGHNLVDFKDLSAKHTGDYKIKLMLWNDLSTLVPLANTAESEITNN